MTETYDFSRADALFVERVNDTQKIFEARNMYADSLFYTTQDKDRVYAVLQMCRIDLFLFTTWQDLSKEEKLRLLTRGRTIIETIEEINRHNCRYTYQQEYYYYYLAFNFFRWEIEERNKLPWALKLKRAYSDALDSLSGHVPYEGGGIYRILSAVKVAQRLDEFGLYDPEKGVKFAKKALEKESTPVRPYPEALSGCDYPENFYYLGRAELGLAMKEYDAEKAKQASKTWADGVKRINEEITDGVLPKGRELETKFYRGKMEDDSKVLSECLGDGSGWKVCLMKKGF